MALTDEALEAVLVGGLEPFRATIQAYDEGWATAGATWVARLRNALGTRALSVEHVGSTSVPGMAAKPVIDLLATVGDPEAPELIPLLSGLGLELRVQSPGRRTLRSHDRSAQVHVFAAGSQPARDLVGLRDHLISNPESRRRYDELKQQLAQREWRDMLYYSEAKGDLIREFLREE